MIKDILKYTHGLDFSPDLIEIQIGWKLGQKGSKIPHMPDKKGEHDWEAIIRAIDPNTPKRDLAAKVAAGWDYHQLKLHGIENQNAPNIKRRLDAALSVLSEDEQKVLDEAHHFLIHHPY